MKVIPALVLVIASVSARGSGPYLPRGWKPEGPAFDLPSEVTKPTADTVQEALFQDTEVSGSDSLKEYGPPELEIFLNVGQNLPDIVTEQPFVVDIKTQDKAAVIEDTVNVEVNTEQLATVVEEISTATESLVTKSVQIEDQVTESSDVQPTTEALVLKAVTEAEISSTSVLIQEVDDREEEVIVPTAIIEGDKFDPTTAVEKTEIKEIKSQEIEPIIVKEVEKVKVSEGINNVVNYIINLEKEVKSTEVQAIENVAEISSTKESSGSLKQAPEGFLEYGPPGFSEYGPPKQEDLARLAVEVDSAKNVENNEIRKRRFSPKFTSTSNH